MIRITFCLLLILSALSLFSQDFRKKKKETENSFNNSTSTFKSNSGLASQDDALRNPVVLINSGSETSAGFLVGNRGNTLFIMTVSHGLEDPSEIRVVFHTGEEAAAEVYESNDRRDIAVIKCQKPLGLIVPPSFLMAKLKPVIDDPVIAIGHPDDVNWSINRKESVVALEYDLDDNLFTITPTLISAGSSGGPVLNKKGELLGITMEVKNQYAKCISSRLLIRGLTTWRVPSNLMTGVPYKAVEEVKPVIIQKAKIDPLDDEMVFVRGGSFRMGSSAKSESPIRTVQIKDFYMSQTEITVTQFQKFVTKTKYVTTIEKKGWSYVVGPTSTGKRVRKDGVSWRDNHVGVSRRKSEYNHPVLHVSWNDAKAYCAWLSKESGKKYRLPTEAEWEYAAGNGRKHTKYSWGDRTPMGTGGNTLTNGAGMELKAKYKDWNSAQFRYADGFAFTAPVGSFGSNEFGLFDMSGNVWEWCEDWYHSTYNGAPSNGSANLKYSPEGRRALRGSSWVLSPLNAFITKRGHARPDHCNYDIGIRVVREP